MCAQSKELNIVAQVWNEIKLLVYWVASSANCVVNVVHLDAHYCRYLIMNLTVKARQRWDDHNYFEFLFVFIGSVYPLYQGFGYRVLHWNEELVLNVNKFPRIIDELDVSL